MTVRGKNVLQLAEIFDVEADYERMTMVETIVATGVFDGKHIEKYDNVYYIVDVGNHTVEEFNLPAVLHDAASRLIKTHSELLTGIEQIEEFLFDRVDEIIPPDSTIMTSESYVEFIHEGLPDHLKQSVEVDRLKVYLNYWVNKFDIIIRRHPTKLDTVFMNINLAPCRYSSVQCECDKYDPVKFMITDMIYLIDELHGKVYYPSHLSFGNVFNISMMLKHYFNIASKISELDIEGGEEDGKQ